MIDDIDKQLIDLAKSLAGALKKLQRIIQELENA